MKLPPFDYACPASIAEAVALLAAHDGEAKPLAGGQSLVPMLAFRVAAPALLVDLRKIAVLRQIKIAADGVTLGAMVRWRDILEDEGLRAAHPLLVAAVEHVAHYQIRNRGTVGGSLAHADPAAELPGIAVTCEAKIAAIGPAGERVIAAADFFQGPLTTALRPDEIITEIRFPAWPARRRFGFTEFARRRGDFALAAAALFYDEEAAAKRATLMSAPSVSPTGRCGSPRSKRSSTATPSMKRPSPRPKRRQPPRSIRRTISMPAALIAKGSSASWSSGRYEALRAQLNGNPPKVQ